MPDRLTTNDPLRGLSPVSWEQIRAATPREDFSPAAFTGLSAGDEQAKRARQLAERDRREQFVVEYAFAIPTPSAIEAIAHFVDGRRLLEVGAGAGLWARLLHDAGVLVTATDDYAWEPSEAKPSKYRLIMGRYFPVEKLDAAEAIGRYSDHAALLICWPPYATRTATDALRAFRGDRLVYIGEGNGGVTADKAFFALLRQEWQLENTVSIPRWPAVHDSVFLYRRG